MGRKEMGREEISTRQSYPDFDGEDHMIGLRAVAAAVRYQGETSNPEHAPKKPRPPAAAVTPERDRDGS